MPLCFEYLPNECLHFSIFISQTVVIATRKILKEQLWQSNEKQSEDSKDNGQRHRICCDKSIIELASLKEP
jgi:hypothetical protein